MRDHVPMAAWQIDVDLLPVALSPVALSPVALSPVDLMPVDLMPAALMPAEVIQAAVTEPETTPTIDDGDRERLSHIIRKDEEMKGYVMGEPVTALCGKRWVPSRDPQRYPVCPKCVDVLGAIRSAGGN